MVIRRSCNLLFWRNHLSSAHLLYFNSRCLFPSSFTSMPFGKSQRSVKLVYFISLSSLCDYCGIIARRVKDGINGLSIDSWLKLNRKVYSYRMVSLISELWFQLSRGTRNITEYTNGPRKAKYTTKTCFETVSSIDSLGTQVHVLYFSMKAVAKLWSRPLTSWKQDARFLETSIISCTFSKISWTTQCK